jgi:hypothetical protein
MQWQSGPPVHLRAEVQEQGLPRRVRRDYGARPRRELRQGRAARRRVPLRPGGVVIVEIYLRGQARKVSGRPKRCKLAHAFLWEDN